MWNTNNSSEDFYKCKAKGIIESIKSLIWINSNCLHLRIKLNEIIDYIIRVQI